MHGIRRLALLGLGLGLAVSACGSDDGGDESASPTQATDSTSTSTPPTESTDPSEPAPTEPSETGGSEDQPPADAPPCADVWQEGNTLQRSYAGCVTDGEYVERDVLGCSSGQRLVRFDETYYGVLGGTVRQAATTPLADDADYREAVSSCRG